MSVLGTMSVLGSNEYMTMREWHRAIIGGRDVILRHTSALVHLQLFSGYVHDAGVEVYAKQPVQQPMEMGHSEMYSAEIGNNGFIYNIVDSFDGIDYVNIRDVRCTSINQTINDMLGCGANMDVQALVEALSRYYYTNNNSFDGLYINPENMERFNSLKDWAVEYYDEG